MRPFAVRNVLINLPGIRLPGRVADVVVQVAVTDEAGDCGCSCTCSSTDGGCTCTCTCTCTQTGGAEYLEGDPAEIELAALKDALRESIARLDRTTAGT